MNLAKSPENNIIKNIGLEDTSNPILSFNLDKSLESIASNGNIMMFAGKAAGLGMKDRYYISPEDFLKMIDSPEKKQPLYIIEKGGGQTEQAPKRKVDTVVRSSVKISGKSTDRIQRISPEDFLRIMDSKDASLAPIAEHEEVPKAPKLTMLPRSIPTGSKLTAPSQQALTKRKPNPSEIYDIKREGKIITIKKKEETPEEKKTKKKLIKKIERNTRKQIREEERRIKKEAKKEEKKARKLEKYRTIASGKRFTEPKKRSLLGRIRLQRKLGKDYFFDIEEDIEEGYITKEDVQASKNAKKRRDRKLYKEVQAYEDAMDDVTVRKGWNVFKTSLAATALAGAVALSAFTYHEVNKIFDSFESSNKVVSVYEMSEAERDSVYSQMRDFKNTVIQTDGYHFDNLSQDEFADGYSRILNQEKRMIENSVRNAALGMTDNSDQRVLDGIVERCFGEEYQTFTEAQRRDYRQLAYELLPQGFPELYKSGSGYIRNPIVMDELAARDNAKLKGYKISLRVNGDEVETVRNLGNILHIINTMQESEYRTIGLSEGGQELFFDSILKDVMSQEALDGLESEQIRDYKQIIYELLPDGARQYIKDPITVERDASIQTNDMER